MPQMGCLRNYQLPEGLFRKLPELINTILKVFLKPLQPSKYFGHVEICSAQPGFRFGHKSDLGVPPTC